jgi:RND family efflux transporter MFP subunit
MRSRLSLLACVAVAAAAAGCRRAPPEEPSPVVRLGPENVVRVEVRELRSGPLISGRLEPRQDATVRAEISGAVLEVLVEAGERVEQGQPLARLDASASPAQLQSAQAAAQSARRGLEVARLEEERARELHEAGALARQDWERAQAARAQAQAQLGQAQAQLTAAREQVARAQVAAPFAGVVSDQFVRPGDLLQPGLPLFRVVDPSSLRLEAQVPVAEREGIEEGVPVEFTVTGVEASFGGVVERVSPVVDPGTGQVRVYVSVDAQQPALLGGQYAQGRIATSVRRAPALPLAAISRDTDPPSVLRVEGELTFRVPVELGLVDPVAEQVELLQGVRPGDLVLTGGVGDLPAGTRVALPAPAAGSEALGGGADAGAGSDGPED